jgi:hypothetical protein
MRGRAICGVVVALLAASVIPAAQQSVGDPACRTMRTDR